MSLRPTALSTTDYPAGLKPLLGYERQLLVSYDAHAELGSIEILAANSGVFTPLVAGAAQLNAAPQEVMAVLEDGYDLGSTDLVITINGTDQNGAALQGIATFTPPGYAQDTSHNFPKGFAANFVTTAGKRFKTIITSGITISGTPTSSNVKFALVGVPTLDATVTGTFKQIGTRVSLDTDPKVPKPTAVQDGRDEGAYIKAGNIGIGTLNVSAKIPSGSDGLARVNGRRVTGWVKELKESKLHTQNILLLGLIMTSKDTVPEDQAPATLSADAMYERYAFIPAL